MQNSGYNPNTAGLRTAFTAFRMVFISLLMLSLFALLAPGALADEWQKLNSTASGHDLGEVGGGAESAEERSLEKMVSIFGISPEDINEEDLNSVLQQVPFISPQERILLRIELRDGRKEVFGIRLEKKKIKSITTGLEDWSLQVEAPKAVIERVAAAEDPVGAALAAVNSGEISVQGRGMAKKVKVVFLRLGLKLAGFFA